METGQPNPRPTETIQTGVADAQRAEETNGGSAAPKIVPPPPGTPPPQPAADDRVRTLSTFHRGMGRPQSASIPGPVLVSLAFALAAGHSGLLAFDGVIESAAASGQLGVAAKSACRLH